MMRPLIITAVALLGLVACGSEKKTETDECKMFRLATANAMAKGWERDADAGMEYLATHCA